MPPGPILSQLYRTMVLIQRIEECEMLYAAALFVVVERSEIA